MKVGVVIGTRPEAIKLAPVILELKKRNITSVVIATAQHRDLLDGQLSEFDIVPGYDLDIMQQNQDIFYVTCAVLDKMKPILAHEMPDVLLLQGDTTTTFAGSLAASYLSIPVGHIEAGLRTWNTANPFPEEINRQVTSRLATFHFASTPWARENLLNEGIPSSQIFITGNPVVDALLMILKNPAKSNTFILQDVDHQRQKIVLLTAHRREHFGEPMRKIFRACRRIVEANPEIVLVYPVHPNPNVRQTAQEELANHERIRLIQPLEYREFVHLMSLSYFIMTDSGGIQEEAPSLGKPVLVLRTTTERPEAIEAGTAKLVGTNEATIVDTAHELLHNRSVYEKMVSQRNPYGDGNAAERIVNILLEKPGSGKRD